MRLLLVDDSRIHAEQLGRSLEGEDFVSQVVTVRGADVVGGAIPDLCTFDLVMLNMTTDDSMGVLRALTSGHDHAPVIAIGLPEDEETVIACAEAGAAGYLSKGGSFADLLAVMQSAYRGETLISPRIVSSLLRRIRTLAAERQPDPLPARLTPREREILHLLEQGMSNKEIGQRLSITVRTVKNHVHSIFEKLQVRRRGEAVALLRRSLP